MANENMDQRILFITNEIEATQESISGELGRSVDLARTIHAANELLRTQKYAAVVFTPGVELYRNVLQEFTQKLMQQPVPVIVYSGFPDSWMHNVYGLDQGTHYTAYAARLDPTTLKTTLETTLTETKTP